MNQKLFNNYCEDEKVSFINVINKMYFYTVFEIQA